LRIFCKYFITIKLVKVDKILIYHYFLNMSKFNWNFTSNTEGRYIWKLLNSTGETLGQSSQSFASKAGAEYNANLLGYNGNFSNQLEWKFFDENGKWKWQTHNTVNKEEVGKSIHGFQTKEEASKNASLFGYGFTTFNTTKDSVDTSEKVVHTTTSYKTTPESTTTHQTQGASHSFASVDDSNKVSQNSYQHSTPQTKESVIPVGSLHRPSGFVDTSKSNAVKPTIVTSSNTTKSTVTSNTKPSSYVVETEDDSTGALGWLWKWLLPLLLLLVLLWWLWWFLTGMGGMKPNMPKLGLNTSSSSTSIVKTTNSSVVTVAPTTNVLQSIGNPDFSVLSGAIKSSGLENALNVAGPVTLLAPTNSAFAGVTLPDLNSPLGLLDVQNLLKNHVLKGNVDLSKLIDGQMVKTISGTDLKASVTDGVLSLGNVVVDTTKDGGNGNISVYSIPDVLEIKSENTAMTPSSIVLSSTSSVVLQSPVSTVTAITYKENSLLDVVQKDGRFGTLLGLLKTADLDDLINKGEALTIFAPTDEAFAKLGTTVADLQKPENKEKLSSILKQHVVLGANDFEAFQNGGRELTNLGGQKIKLSLDDQGVGVVTGSRNSAMAPVEDIKSNNTIIHILTDSVLLN
jgi:transforming growth factor-beta-induced protein